MPIPPRLPFWLDLLRTLHPARGVLLVGAGDGSSAWVKRLMQWDARHVTLVEGDETQFRHLHDQVADRGGWTLLQQVVAAEPTHVTYHHASLAIESGLIAPESLQPLWPHLTTRLARTHCATTLDALMQDSDQTPNWLMVDCLPALSLLQGATDHLQGIEVIAARVLFGSDPLAAGPAGQLPLQTWLEARGFVLLDTESGRHPAIGHAVFVRNTQAGLQTLTERLADATRHQHQLAETLATLQTTSTDQAEAARAEIARLSAVVRQTQTAASHLCARQVAKIEHLTQALEGADTLARDQQQRLDQLQQATVQAAAEAAAADATATATARTHADEIARLAQAREAADKLAADRHRTITQLRQAATLADTAATTHARTHADEIARLTQALQAADTLARDQQQRLDQARKKAAQFQAEALQQQQELATQLDQQSQARAAADKLAADLRTQAQKEARRSRGDADIDDLIRDISPYFTERSITYVDVGAYVGDVFLKLTGSRQLRVREAHLYEPNPASYQTLTTKLESSRLPTLHAYHLAVGARPDTLHFNAAQSMTRVVVPEPGSPQISNTFTAHSVTLDEQARLFTDQRIHLLKIDVEGRELDVLTGATELLQAQRIDMLYIEVGFNRQGTQQAYFADIDLFLQDKGYRVFRIYEQMNEWTEDSPLLRRCNFAYMSERFARANPSKLTRRLQTLQEELHRLKSTQTPPLTPASPPSTPVQLTPVTP